MFFKEWRNKFGVEKLKDFTGRSLPIFWTRTTMFHLLLPLPPSQFNLAGAESPAQYGRNSNINQNCMVLLAGKLEVSTQKLEF